MVGGWWDQEDFWGSLATYAALEKFDDSNHNFLVMGPWNHGGWNGPGKNLGKIQFDSETGSYYRAEIQAPWFAYYLKDKGKAPQPEAMTFQTGSNRWTSSDHWPPKEAKERELYLRAGKGLSFEKPTTNRESDFASYQSDPQKPVLY